MDSDEMQLLSRIDERTKFHAEELQRVRNDVEAINRSHKEEIEVLRREFKEYVRLTRYIWVERLVFGFVALILTITLGAVFKSSLVLPL